MNDLNVFNVRLRDGTHDSVWLDDRWRVWEVWEGDARAPRQVRPDRPAQEPAARDLLDARALIRFDKVRRRVRKRIQSL